MANFTRRQIATNLWIAAAGGFVVANAFQCGASPRLNGYPASGLNEDFELASYGDATFSILAQEGGSGSSCDSGGGDGGDGGGGDPCAVYGNSLTDTSIDGGQMDRV